MIIVEYLIMILSVIGLLWAGIFIGREFGTFENFAVWYIKHISGTDGSDIELPAERLELLESMDE